MSMQEPIKIISFKNNEEDVIRIVRVKRVTIM